MYVVKRPFKSFGKFYAVGTVITDPTAIKRFNGKVAEGKIVNVTEQTYDSAAKYFKSKFFVDLPPLALNSEEIDDNQENTDDNQESTDEVKSDENQAEPDKAPVVAVAKVSAVSAK